MHDGAWQHRPAKPPLSTADLAISISALVLTVLLGGAGAVMGFFMLVFLDYCPPASCSVDGAVTAVMTAVLVAGLVGAIGLIVTIVQLVRRKPAWPFAIGTFAACMTVLVIGGVGYFAAVS